MSTGSPDHFDHLLEVSKWSLWILILYTFFNYFKHVYSPRARADKPLGSKFWCQQKALTISTICCKFKIISLNSDFIHLFNVFPHVYSPGAGADNLLWTKFWCQQEGLVTLPICCKFQKNIVEAWFYIIFACLYTCIKPQGRGRQPPGVRIFILT